MNIRNVSRIDLELFDNFKVALYALQNRVRYCDLDLHHNLRAVFELERQPAVNVDGHLACCSPYASGAASSSKCPAHHDTVCPPPIKRPSLRSLAFRTAAIDRTAFRL